jgi:hypothetical protein
MRIAARGISFGFDASLGHLDGFEVEDGGLRIAPLHRAPWVGRETLPEGLAPHLHRLGGDFFCAPFAASEGGSPMHGWTANAPWTAVGAPPGTLRAVLGRTVQGATVVKDLTLQDGHPFVYQRHVFLGGEGRITVANHANVSLPDGGLIRSSPKAGWETPATALEPDPARGRSALRYPARATDPTAFPGAAGPVDLTRYPWAPRHEDFVIGIEAAGHWLGWTAVTRPAQGDLYLSLRNARALPTAMLWHSNGGRDYPPWSGRHFGCLGVEEGAAAAILSLTGEDGLSGPGALTLRPGGSASVVHVIGAIAWPSGEPVARIEPAAGGIRITGEGRAVREVPCLIHLLEG